MIPTDVERDFPLSRITTIRAGGKAQYFARVGSLEQLSQLLGWVDVEGLAVSIVGSGSNLLVADAGVSGLVLKLDRALAQIAIDGVTATCGGGARLPAIAARTAQAGLTGLEFGVSIPGTVGGAVKMNANAYGGQLEQVLVSVDVATARGVVRRQPHEFAFQYRYSNLQQGAVVVAAEFALEQASVAAVKAKLAELRQHRREVQPSGIKTFGSTFKNPTARAAAGRSSGQLLDGAGCKGLQVGPVRFSPQHANFVENLGDARTIDVLALMAAGRQRVYDKYKVQLEPEVQVLGAVEFPAGWELE